MSSSSSSSSSKAKSKQPSRASPNFQENVENSDGRELGYSSEETVIAVTETRAMSSRSSKSSSQSSHSHSSHSSKHKSSSSKHVSSKNDDWTTVTDAEERRRIQNRLAQRKYRDKKKEEEEAQYRDSENREKAGAVYRTAADVDYDTDEELSGLPWGSLSLSHVVRKGAEKREGEGSGSGSGRGGYYYSGQ